MTRADLQKSMGYGTLAIFALPSLLGATLQSILGGILPTLYAEKFAINMVALGGVLLASRVFDAVIDPTIGYLSDITRSPWGPRKPWLIVGSLIAAGAVRMLCAPGDQGDATQFLIWSLVLYFGWSLLEIPYSAWSLEAGRDPIERNRIFSFRIFALYAGGVVIALMPQLVPGAGGKMTFAVLDIFSLGFLVLFPLFTLLTCWVVPRGPIQSEKTPKLSSLWGSVRRNGPFKTILVMYVCIGVAGGVSGALAFVFLTQYLKLADRFTQVTIPYLLIGPLLTPVWSRILSAFDLRRVTTVIFTVYTGVMASGIFITPGPDAFWGYIAYTMGLAGLYPALSLSMPVLLGDAVDYDELMSGSNRSGQYYSFLVLIQKGTMALGGPLGFLIAGAFGFTLGKPNSDLAILGMRLSCTALPALMVVPALFLLWTFPLDSRRRSIIERRLKQRSERAARHATPDGASA